MSTKADEVIEVTFKDLDTQTFVFSKSSGGYVYKLLRSLEARQIKDRARRTRDEDITTRYGDNTQWQ
jgi:hypothetical protein